jgi:hypothetical protein
VSCKTLPMDFNAEKAGTEAPTEKMLISLETFHSAY